MLTLKKAVSPRLTLIWVAKPWMLGSPAPLMSHSLAGLPVRQFSATIGLGEEVQGSAAVVNDQVTLAASALPATSFARGSVAPPLSVAE